MNRGLQKIAALAGVGVAIIIGWMLLSNLLIAMLPIFGVIAVGCWAVAKSTRRRW